MSVNLLQLQNQTLSLLNEASSSSVAEVPTGTGGSATITTANALTYWLNQAAAAVCRSCLPLLGTGTYSQPAASSSPTGALDVLLNGLSVSGNEAGWSFIESSTPPQTMGGSLWAARGAAYSGMPLTHCSRAALELANPSWQQTAAGTPLYWFDEGQGNIGVYPYPSASGTISVTGLIVPPPLANATDTVSWLPDDLTPLLTLYAAVQVANKNFEDPSLSGRAPVYQAEWQDLCMRLWNRIDPLLKLAHFSTPPQAMVTGPQGSTA